MVCRRVDGADSQKAGVSIVAVALRQRGTSLAAELASLAPIARISAVRGQPVTVRTRQTRCSHVALLPGRCADAAQAFPSSQHLLARLMEDAARSRGRLRVTIVTAVQHCNICESCSTSDVGVLSSLPAEALCADLAASTSDGQAHEAWQPAAPTEQQPGAAGNGVQLSSWTFLINGALAAALDAAAAPPDGHHRVYAMAAVSAALEKVEELLKVGLWFVVQGGCSICCR